MPERTCIGCGAREPQGAMVRLRIDEGRVAVDRARAGGRGAWIHATPACLSRAVARKAFARAFRQAVAVDAERLRAALMGSVDGKCP